LDWHLSSLANGRVWTAVQIWDRCLPACYLVAVAYAAMAIAALVAPRRLTWMFLLGWLPVFALAAMGSTLELSGRPTCPVSSSGTPMCYYSLALAATLLPLFFFARTFSTAPASS